MCGVAGWVGKRGEVGDESILQSVRAILEEQHHRGPDARGLWKSPGGNAVLGHNRLSIIDLSSTGAQPMVDRDSGVAISYNGELYNYKGIRAHLEKQYGERFAGSSDTEVFLKGVKRLGIDRFLQMADGMFAVAIWDDHEATLTLIRDRAGEKPLCYSTEGDNLFFASEMRALARGLKSSPVLDESALYFYFLLRYVPAPFSMFKGIKKVPPGHYVRFREGFEPEVIPYFSWDPASSEVLPSQRSYESVIEQTEKLLVESLSSRLMSDVPLGFFLSGGIDSSLTAALVRKHFGIPITTYTIAFEGDPESEHEVSAQTAKIIGSRHVTRTLTLAELSNVSSGFVGRMDEPNGDRSCVPTYLLCRHASAEVRVALGGDGGDELFGGYGRYQGLSGRLNESRFARSLDAARAYFQSSLPVFGLEGAAQATKGAPNSASALLESWATNLFPPANPERAIRNFDFVSYLPGAVLSKVDRMGMLCSLEVRTPFFSPSLLHLASSLPHAFLYQGGHLKPVLRDLTKKLGLSHVAGLPKKGFGMPGKFLELSRDSLAARTLNALKVLDSNPLVPKELTGLGSRIRSFVGANANSLWAAIVLGEWLDSYTDTKS
jgi:asparagine synthase (glutamine-hydrolysing)